jgi:hypothetical protein
MEKALKTSIVSITEMALLFTAATAQQKNQTSNEGGQNSTGRQYQKLPFSLQVTIQKL